MALIFIKPHAIYDQVKAFVAMEIANKGLTVLCEGEKSAEDIESSGAIDTHYASIAEAALTTEPADLNITDQKKKEFSTKFGTEWAAALDLGIILNAKQAGEKLEISGADLDQKWAKNSDARMKLAPGLYVENINEVRARGRDRARDRGRDRARDRARKATLRRDVWSKHGREGRRESFELSSS